MQLMAYDRWRINDFTRELDAIGVQLLCSHLAKGLKDMAPAVDKLEQLVLGHKLRHGDNPVLNMCAANAIAERDPAGNRKLNKAKSTGRIDGLGRAGNGAGGGGLWARTEVAHRLGTTQTSAFEENLHLFEIRALH